MKSILDPSFSYTSSLHTDVRKTFDRVRRELQCEATNGGVRSDRGSGPLVLQRGSAAFADLQRANGTRENGRTRRPS